MTRKHRAVLLGILLFVSTFTSAQAKSWEPLDAIGGIAGWFRKLTRDFDEVVTVEKRSQLLRSVDRLRKGLYTLEIDTRFLLDAIPDQKPTMAQHEQLDQYVRDLLATIGKLSMNLKEVGADLRLTSKAEQLDLDQIDEKLASGLRTRMMTLSYVQEQLAAARSSDASWNPEPIRERLRKGLQAVKDAQLAITEFQSKLAKQ